MACGHKGCRCNETDVELAGGEFCSENCAEDETAGAREPSCRCGHADCAAV